jgi:hypothetical protein
VERGYNLSLGEGPDEVGRRGRGAARHATASRNAKRACCGCGRASAWAAPLSLVGPWGLGALGVGGRGAGPSRLGQEMLSSSALGRKGVRKGPQGRAGWCVRGSVGGCVVRVGPQSLGAGKQRCGCQAGPGSAGERGAVGAGDGVPRARGRLSVGWARRAAVPAGSAQLGPSPGQCGAVWDSAGQCGAAPGASGARARAVCPRLQGGRSGGAVPWSVRHGRSTAPPRTHRPRWPRPPRR